MTLKKHIPNVLTLLNLFCGCVAIVFIASFQFEMAFFMVCLGIFFDFFDGFFARKFGVSGPLGVQLDSLADMVTSGVAPGFVMYCMMLKSSNALSFSFFPFLGFLITLGACYRLANFNIDTRQSDSFIGLPTPANTLFIMSLPIITTPFFYDIIHNKWVMVFLVILSAYVMNAEIPLFSLKIKNFTFKKYLLQIIFVLIAIVLLVLFKIVAIPLIILLYVLVSVGHNIFSKK